MAYGLKYFSRYKDSHGIIKEIRFLKIDYVGPVKEWHNTYGACDIDQGASDAFFDKPIVTSQARISLFLEEQYDLSEFVYDRKTFFCQRVIPAVGATPEKIEWTGWLEPWDAARPYKKPPWTVSLTASCGLAHLSKKKYVNPDNTFKKTGLKLIQECLEIIGSELGLRVSTHMYENSWIGDPEFGLASFEINTARFYDQNGEAMYCDEIVTDILDHHTAELTQWDNRWVVRSIVDHATGFERSYRELPFNDGPAVPASPWPGTYIINDTDAFSVDGGQIRILPPITKYRTEVDLGSQTPYFENGNMVLWTNDGLVGWDFSHMPKGNPGWEQYHIGGDPDAPSVLKINGKAPGPYDKKKKKTLRQILGQGVMITTLGVVQYTVDNKRYHIEPSEWIETSAGRVSPGDKKITISFDYETEPFSSNIIIALRFPSATNPAITYWGQPFQENVPAGQTYRFIIVPPLDREGVIGRGHIDVSGNPNYPDGNIPGWTYVIEGIPPGQTRKIGGAAGVVVENDDIIISKISNPGGTQAAVGASWEVINIRVNVQKGTFEIPIDFTAANEKMPIPVEEIFIRFYKITEHPDKTGDWYKVYNLKGTIEGFVAKDDASKYATTLERGSKTDEEAETIHHITGDYNPWYSGSLTIPGSIENTKSWRRRPDLDESLSIYRAEMLDRLCLTSRPLDILEGEITLMPGAPFLSYLHTLVLADRGNMRMRIVRYSFNDYSRKVKVTAIQVKYEEIPVEELRQDSYIPGSRLLNPVSGQGDGVYPTKQDSSSGRVNAEEIGLTNDELAEALGASSGGRLGAIFDITVPLQYVEKVKSTDSINLFDYVTAAFNDLNDDQETDDIFDLNTLSWVLTDKPDWLTDITIIFLDVTATARAPKAGMYYLYYDVTDPESGLVFEVKIPIRVNVLPKLVTTLLDTAIPKTIGIIPGAFKLPAKLDIQSTITGYHNNLKMILSKGSIEILDVFMYADGGETELQSYKAFQETDGIVVEPGLYKLDQIVLTHDLHVIERTIFFTLYTDEFLAKARFELWNAAKIGNISIQDDSKFKNPDWYDVKGIVSDIEHDKATLTLTDLDDVEIKKTIFTHLAPETDIDYFLYGTPQVNRTAGQRRINLKLELAGDLVMERQNDFEILAKPPVAKGGLFYGTMIPYTANFVEVMELPLAGAEVDLPINGINFMAKIRGEFDYVSWLNFRLEGESFVEFTGFNITKKPNSIAYPEIKTEADILAFWEASSRDLGVHEAPSKFRTKFIVRLGGENGEIVQIIQGDLGFRIPLDPSQLSGLRFLNIDHLSGEEQLIDSNIPKTGRTFSIPKYSKFWTASFKKLTSGLEFDQVVFKLKKDGVILHLFVTDGIIDFHTGFPNYPGNKAMELLTDHEAYVFGNFVTDHRILKNPANVDVNIDVPGTYVLTADAYRFGTLMESQEAEITLVDEEDIEEVPEADCCGVMEWFSVAW